jgi:hypothetical protein
VYSDLEATGAPSVVLVSSRFVHVYIPTQAQFEILHHACESSTISTGLRQAPNIKTLVVWDCTHYTVDHVPAYMRTIAANPALEHIQIKPIVSPQNQLRFARRMELYDSMKEDARLKVLLDLRDEM